MSGRGRPKTTVCNDKADYVPLHRLTKEREDEALMTRARLAKSDLDYAESPCAARVTVDCVRTTDGRTLVVETRGQRCVGWRSAGHVSHS